MYSSFLHVNTNIPPIVHNEIMEFIAYARELLCEDPVSEKTKKEIEMIFSLITEFKEKKQALQQEFDDSMDFSVDSCDDTNKQFNAMIQNNSLYKTQEVLLAYKKTYKYECSEQAIKNKN